MPQKFNPAPPDKHSEKPAEAVKRDIETTNELDAGLIGGSFPASDPRSEAQPAPSKYDAEEPS
jgi:hypothetical protein